MSVFVESPKLAVTAHLIPIVIRHNASLVTVAGLLSPGLVHGQFFKHDTGHYGVSEGGDSVKNLARLGALGAELAAAVVAGTLLGYYIDSKLGTEPWLMLLGMLAGFLGGLRIMFKSLKTP
jgi:hypothetical protein